MATKEKDIKLLWGRAANRCSFPDCRIKLSQDKKMATESFPIGEQAHIVGKEEGSSRSYSILSVSERDSYHNLILLCPNHHTLVDKNPQDYPIEKLHMIKAQHEYWVESTLSESHDIK
ncbi:MAG: HNH endonuclease signature motif containing protein, partial [Deltaproteobacteria bacterium]